MKQHVLILLSIFTLFSTSLTAAPIQQDTSGLHLDWLDQTVKPGDDFFDFANGSWRKKNPIPAAYPMWSAAHVLNEENIKIIHQIIQDIAKKPDNKPGSVEQKIGDFYNSGMNETAINKLGATPLQPEFLRIENIHQFTELQQEIAHLQLLSIDVPFNFDQMQDYIDSQQVIGVASQGGLGLPDRDYYLKNDKKFIAIRKEYVAHIIRMLTLLGDKPENAKRAASTIMAIETGFAKASLSRIEQRNPHAVYHPMNLDQLQKITPNFNWKQFFTELGYANIKKINVSAPVFFAFMNIQLKTIPLEDWKAYFRWHLIRTTAPVLSQPFVDESFYMTKKLMGTQELLPRWRRVVSEENTALGFAIGKIYVEKMFPPSSKETVEAMVGHIRNALKTDLETIPWMTPETRQAALKKLSMMESRIGYPNKWRDYSTLKIDQGPYVLNILRSAEFLKRYALNKIGKPVNNSDWDMLPQEVNAYYDPSRNNLNLPAGILQPPFFDPKANAAINYGAIGSVIGHEMTHGFDDQGAQFDGQGNLKNWWTPEDLKKFQLATGCIVREFSQFKLDGYAVQGKLVSGEAIADLSGMILAFNAFRASPDYANAHPLYGFTPDQQFFIGEAHVWASNIRPEEARNLIVIDPHPPAMYRVNGTLLNMPQFQAAFGLLNNSPMVSQNRCVIW